ncbi:MAG TPA: hypothetical protein VF505_16795 [Thermoanaerobaculia bacterium]
MQTKKSLSLQIAGATALAMLFGTSAFAESRHHSGTSSSSGGHSDRSSGSRSSGSRSSGSSVQRGGSASRSQSRSADRGSWQNGQTQRNTTREFSQRDNNTQRSIARDTQRSDWRGNSNQRNDSRGNSNQRNDSRYNNSRNGQRSIANDRFRSVAGWRPGGRAPYAVHERVSSFGRVDRFERWNGGYRVWIGGGLYPIFVPFERWRLFPLRIGLNIRFGGFWDPLGYWSVYDYSPYDGYYGGGYANVYGYNDGYNNDGYNNDAYTSGEVRGTVESIDFRRGTMVINDDTSRQFVTITLPRDRRIDDIRAGDYVEFSGGWTRRGVFEASRLERFDEGRGDGRDDRRSDPRDDDRRY